MRCKNCIAFGYDFISRLCIAGYSDMNFSGIHTFKNGDGCRLTKEGIEKRVKDAMSKRPNRFTQYRKDWGDGE